jgi:hypothetical protein
VLSFVITIRRSAAFAAKSQVDGESFATDEGESIDKHRGLLISFQTI